MAVGRTTQKKAPESEYVRGNGAHIFVIDDEIENVSMFERMLKKQGYKVTTKTDSREALEIFRANPDRFDLVITDQTMPHMTGKQLARKLTDIRPQLPVILISGLIEELSPDQLKEFGIRLQIKKPVTKAELYRAVQQALQKP